MNKPPFAGPGLAVDVRWLHLELVHELRADLCLPEPGALGGLYRSVLGMALHWLRLAEHWQLGGKITMGFGAVQVTRDRTNQDEPNLTKSVKGLHENTFSDI